MDCVTLCQSWDSQGPGEADERCPSIVVIGGGLAGLAAAVWLAEAGKQVTLLDRLSDHRSGHAVHHRRRAGLRSIRCRCLVPGGGPPDPGRRRSGVPPRPIVTAEYGESGRAAIRTAVAPPVGNRFGAGTDAPVRPAGPALRRPRSRGRGA
ncbi:FAD-dependent oxidoreductase [Nocardia grenadensis]|uniref:FAD-dependent oxidoreductase n=1 Tax=Nocardia grenadensis TaxID=931537 RepID=UPI002480A82D|nr:FAD-dependent oxidoreductase [Nocardia grenadensis]